MEVYTADLQAQIYSADFQALTYTADLQAQIYRSLPAQLLAAAATLRLQL